MIRFLLFCFIYLGVGIVLYGQEDYMLSPSEKAYMFHTVRKSPILENSIGRYIVYNGTEIILPNGDINYDSTETLIINQPELLQIYSDEIRRSPKGILAELANKMAIWQLNKALNSYSSNTLSKDGNTFDFELFNKKIIESLPGEALQQKRGETIIHKRVERLSNPSLTFKDKLAMLNSFSSWSLYTKKAVIDAYNFAVNEWVSNRSQQIFEKLGGEATLFENILTAAGDGSSTSGLFEEREKDERGRWNKGLPKAVGLFPYTSEIQYVKEGKKERQEIKPQGFTRFDFTTPGEGKQANIHLDVWGYNSTKQTTVVIQRGRYSYPLFGSESTRFLSPDSAYGGGITYYTLIKRLQLEIDAIEEMISGKKGFDYWIAYYEDKRYKAKLDYDKTEKELNDWRYDAHYTNSKKLKPTKVSKKNKDPNAVTVMKTESVANQRIKKQEKVVGLYEFINGMNRRIAQLQEDKEKAVQKKQSLETKKQIMLERIGENWVSFTEKDGLYIFSDSARFDINTQEFTFPPSDRKVPFEVKLLAMPRSHHSEQYDEVMLHINITDVEPDYTARFQLDLEDIFEVDQIVITKTNVFTLKDSIGVVEFFEALLDKKKAFSIDARGGGIGKWKNNRIVIDYEPEEMANYPGNTQEERIKSKALEEFKRLRKTQVNIFVDRETLLEVNSFTDPVKSNFIAPEKKIEALKDKFKLTNNQLLSAYRTYNTLKQIKKELNLLAGKYLNRGDASKAIDRLNKTIDKTKITVGSTSIKYKSF